MTPREARIAPLFSVREIGPEECLRGWRSVRVGDLDHPELPLSFRSHYEEGYAPRYQQTQHAALHTSVSFWRSEETALAVARQFDLRHGEFLAQVVFTFGYGFDCLDRADERHPEHLTIWGAPASLAAAAVDIVPIEQ